MDWKPPGRRNGPGYAPTPAGCPTDCPYSVTLCGICVFADVPGNFAFGFLCEYSASIDVDSARFYSRYGSGGGTPAPDSPPENEDIDQETIDSGGDAAREFKKSKDNKSKAKKGDKNSGDDTLEEIVCNAIKKMKEQHQDCPAC